MKDLQTRTKRSLCFLGLDPTHRGYSQLFDCIIFQAEHHYSKISAVYFAVSLNYGIQQNSVTRNISYTLKKVDNLSQKLSLLLGFKISDPTLHNSSIINYLADFVSYPELFNFSA